MKNVKLITTSKALKRVWWVALLAMLAGALITAIAFNHYDGLRPYGGHIPDEDYNFVFSNGRFSGWQMGCNLVDDWKGRQDVNLDCANGLVYQQINVSKSVTFFNPDTLQKHCFGENEVDVFNASGEFVRCMEW